MRQYSELSPISWTGKSSELCGNLIANVIVIGEVSRYLVTYFCMSPNAIIEHFNILKDDPFSILSGFKAIMMQTFSFDGAKEAFHRCIVPTITFATH